MLRHLGIVLWCFLLIGVAPSRASAQDDMGASSHLGGPGTPEGGGGGGGDGVLIYAADCTGWANGFHIDDELSLTLEIVAGGRVIATQTFWGTGFIRDAYVEGSFPATGNDQSVHCNGSVSIPSHGYYRWATLDTKTAPGAGPDFVEIRVNAFIGQNWVCRPQWDGACMDIFGGNNRSFSYSASSNSKLTSTTIAVNSALFGYSMNGSSADGGWSEEFEKCTSLSSGCDGVLTAEALADWQPGSPMKQDWAQGDGWGGCNAETLGTFIDGDDDWTSRTRLVCNYKADNPLMPSPFIDVNFTVDFKFGYNVAAYTITGCHDGFPSYEVYFRGQGVHGYQEQGSAWSLWGTCDASFNASGSISR